MRRGTTRSRLAAGAALAAVAGASAAAAVAGPRGTPPPGATALCRDGTYSYSATHSGTCSHHGGVAQWLDGSDGAATTPAPAAAPAPRAAVAPAIPGRTVLLGRRTAEAGCRLGPLPDRRCSPGAYSAGLTRDVLCSAAFRTGSIRNVSGSEKHAVEVEYGLAARSYGRSLEIDHIVSLELGGSNEIANLFPEEAALPGGAPGYHVKDALENELHRMVCAGEIGLRTAQREIAANWEALYRRVYGRTPTG